jgi:predicted ATPase/class 3 adenylate cyclase
MLPDGYPRSPFQVPRGNDVCSQNAEELRVLPSGIVTFLMTDIEGSTRLFRELGDSYADVLATHNSLLRSAVSEHDGTEVKTEGDSFLVAFEDAGDALAACLDGQRALAAGPWPPGIVVTVRMGVHTGEATPVGDDYVALAIHQVARISAGAHGGQVLVSDATARDVENRLPSGADLVELGSFQLRGFASPERLHQLRHPDLREDFPPPRAMGVLAHNLPFHRTSFVGRSVERSSLAQLLGVTGVVSIVGPGGVGKTRLAVQLAFDVMEDFVDGAWIAELAPLTTPEAVARGVASAMGVTDEPGRNIEDLVIETLQPKKALLILDNCEHVLDTIAHLADRITTRCPGIVIIATSREPLGIDGEAVWRVDPLDWVDPAASTSLTEAASTESVQLFVERAALVKPGFQLTEENLADVLQILAHLNGIPLAIELAAAALSERSPQGVLDGLTDRFSLLTHGRRTAPDRHQTLRAAIEWSLDLLEPGERKLFDRLSVFAGSWTTEAASEVCGYGPVISSDVPGMLRHLARASLLAVDPESADRWSMLESIRQLGSIELASLGEVDDVAERHRDWYLRRVEMAAGDIGRRGRTEVMDGLVSDHDNIRQALNGAISDADVPAALRLCASMSPFWTSHGDWTEGIAFSRRALSLNGGNSTDRAKARAGLGRLLLLTGDLTAAHRCFLEAKEEADAADHMTIARALLGVGYVAFRHSQLADAEEHWEQALLHAERAGDQRISAEVLRSLAIARGSRGEQSAAEELLERAIGAAEQAEDDQLLRLLLGSAAETKIWLGRYREAEDAYGDALALATEIGDFSARPLLLAELGWIAILRGDVARAWRLATEAEELAEDLNNPRVLTQALRLSGEAQLHLGDPDRATNALERALETSENLGAPAEVAGVLCSLARLALEQREFDDARLLAEKAHGLSELAHTMRLVTPTWVIGAAALGVGDIDRAEQHFLEDTRESERMGIHRYQANGLWGLGCVNTARRQIAEAAGQFQRSIELRHEIGDRLGVVEALVGLASAASEHEPSRALELLEDAQALRAEIGATPTPLESLRVSALSGILATTGDTGDEPQPDQDGIVARAIELARALTGM